MDTEGYSSESNPESIYQASYKIDNRQESKKRLEIKQLNQEPRVILERLQPNLLKNITNLIYLPGTLIWGKFSGFWYPGNINSFIGVY